ncbi:MAG: hypothetical protein J6S85_13250 [Methanobrevibacter sp.]|nr:hypothetical protein [Methanobrevibacter sp.]
MTNVERKTVVERFTNLMYEEIQNATDIKIAITQHTGECPTIRYDVTENIIPKEVYKNE